MREDEIKRGIQQICDLSKEISKCSEKDNSALIDKLNNLHEEDFNLLGKKYDKSKPDDAVNFLRRVVLDYLREGKKLDKQKLKEFNDKYRKVTNDEFKIYQTDFYVFQPFTVSCYYHKPISEFIKQFVNEIIERLQLKGQVEHSYVNYGNSAERRSTIFWLDIYNRQKLQSTESKFFIEFDGGKIKYGIIHQSNQYYMNGPEIKNSEDFDFESLISFFKENKESVLQDKSKVEVKEVAKPVLDNTNSQRENISMKESPRNLILYGPPGTGKTYNTIDMAVEIITGNKASHQENKEVFDILREEGQIEFITFHQNYSYEDFIIGIRPDLEEASTLKFRRKEGIFYKMCKRAEQNYLQSQNKKSSLRPFKEIFLEFIAPLEKEEVEIEIKMNSGKSSFWITEINPSNLSFRKQSGGATHNTLSIDTIQSLYEGTRVFTSGFLRTYYEPLISELWRRGKQTTTESLNRYVLIIDEINRANVSKVFGELITLLEEDKRLGAKNELRISIPGEETGFGIPPNVYIIGTMNTADKSIAMIDIALRRRFEFRGYFPDYNKVDELSGEILKHINKQIYQRKKSADYLIGHGYFMNGDEPPETFEVLQNKVIPLLMEYFSGKTDVVEEIFKGSEWSVKYDTEKYYWDIEPQIKQ